MCDFEQFVQFKKREKHPWMSDTSSTFNHKSSYDQLCYAPWLVEHSLVHWYQQCEENSGLSLTYTFIIKSTKSNTPPWEFFTCLKCTNGSKLCKASHRFKACVRYFLPNFYFSPNDSPSKTMKKVFLFHLRSSFRS